VRILPALVALGLVSLGLGLLLPIKSWKVILAGGVAWGALAFIFDGESHGLISQRMGGLFALPSAYLMFVVMAAIGAVTAGIFFQAGAGFRRAKRH